MDEFLKNITCSGTDCLSWILVLLNILAIFYLVFCSFWKVTRVAKITGWVWSAGLLCATAGILIAHTCVYTLLTTIFTAMMIMAILAVILPKPNANKNEEEKVEKLGSYVISKTDDERFVFAIYDSAKKHIINSKYAYKTLEEVKKEIFVCRDNGMMAAINDKTGAWIREEYYPSFDMYVKDGKYHFCLKINSKYTILDSGAFSDIKSCEKMLDKTKKMVSSTSVYLNTQTVSGKTYQSFDARTAQVIEEVEQKPVDEKTILEAPTEIIAEETVEEKEQLAQEGQITPDVADDDLAGGVAFTAEKKTLWDKYAELTKEQRSYFDRIRDYAGEKESVKGIEAKDYLTFKFGKDKLVRLRIRRGLVEAVFMLVSSSFKNTYSGNDIKVKEAATIIRVENEAYLDVALKTLDKQYEALAEERRLHKEEQKAKRRQSRKSVQED